MRGIDARRDFQGFLYQMILHSLKVPGQESSPCRPRHDLISQKLRPKANTHSENGVRFGPDAMAAKAFFANKRWRNDVFRIQRFAIILPVRHPDWTCVKGSDDSL